VTIHPTMVLGPLLQSSMNTSNETVLEILNGKNSIDRSDVNSLRKTVHWVDKVHNVKLVGIVAKKNIRSKEYRGCSHSHRLRSLRAKLTKTVF